MCFRAELEFGNPKVIQFNMLEDSICFCWIENFLELFVVKGFRI